MLLIGTAVDLTTRIGYRGVGNSGTVGYKIKAPTSIAEPRTAKRTSGRANRLYQGDDGAVLDVELGAGLLDAELSPTGLDAARLDSGVEALGIADI
jgi:hypothetical protein